MSEPADEPEGNPPPGSAEPTPTQPATAPTQAPTPAQSGIVPSVVDPSARVMTPPVAPPQAAPGLDMPALRRELEAIRQDPRARSGPSQWFPRLNRMLDFVAH